jgi:phosphoglycolate phosphatase-like HAD superfamily hydrolase
MKNTSKDIKNILWDFDGVILDSMKIRDIGFEQIFNSFDKDKVDLLLKYHRANGGLSRYVKIKYFFENILDISISEIEVLKYANEFSIIMREKLVDKKNLIQDSLSFIKKNKHQYNFHIVSGSDQEELRFLCKELKIANNFLSIHGSPTPKIELVKMVLNKERYNKKETCLIGDSINDFEAAKQNEISFMAYNNPEIENLSDIDALF